jgi:hypothetical protein
MSGELERAVLENMILHQPPPRTKVYEYLLYFNDLTSVEYLSYNATVAEVADELEKKRYQSPCMRFVIDSDRIIVVYWNQVFSLTIRPRRMR